MQIYFCRRGPETALKSGFKAMRFGWPCKKKCAISKIAGFVWTYSLNWIYLKCSPGVAFHADVLLPRHAVLPNRNPSRGWNAWRSLRGRLLSGFRCWVNSRGLPLQTWHVRLKERRGNLLKPGVSGRAVYWRFGLGESKCCVKFNSPDCALTTIHFLDLIFYRLPVESKGWILRHSKEKKKQKNQKDERKSKWKWKSLGVLK